MPPAKSRQPRLLAPQTAASKDMSTQIAPVQLLPTKTGATPTRSPARSPAKRGNGISATQRQALVDNLQLEIMERAAKLRAQYALQAQSLRMRLEMRVNRIPVALRKMTIGELLEKYEEGKENASRRVASPAKTISRVPQARLSPAKSALKPPQQRGTKRTSTAMELSSDHDAHENTHVSPLNPKKRRKGAGPPLLPSTTNAIAHMQSSTHQPAASAHSNILSPRSNNTRTLPQPPSPTKFLYVSPLKPQGARPMSPTKPSATITTTTAASRAKTAERVASKQKAAPASRPGSRAAPMKAKTPAAMMTSDDVGMDGGRQSMDSSASSSAGTTIVASKSRGLQGNTASATAKKVIAAGKAAVKKKAPVNEVKVEMVESVVKGGRTLRKRNGV